MKQSFSSLEDSVNSEMFSNAKECMLKAHDELVNMKNGFWLDVIWQKEHRNIDLYTNRRAIIANTFILEDDVETIAYFSLLNDKVSNTTVNCVNLPKLLPYVSIICYLCIK